MLRKTIQTSLFDKNSRTMPVTCFSDFGGKINYAWLKTQKVLERTGEISFKWLLFLTVLSRAVFRTQSKVYGGAFCKNS